MLVIGQDDLVASGRSQRLPLFQYRLNHNCLLSFPMFVPRCRFTDRPSIQEQM
jgi:hypothetical protein